MHVLILPSWYFPHGSDEIAGRMFHHLAGGLREAGIDARIFYPEYSTNGPWFNTTTFETEEGVPTYRVRQWFPGKANSLLYKLWIKECVTDLQRYIKKHGKPDLIHAQSYMAASICAGLQKKIKIPYIYTERLSSFLTRTIPKFHLPFFKDIFSTASVVTCVSPGLAEIMEPHSPKPIRILPNFYDEKIFHPDPTLHKQDAFTWVSIGEPADIKGLDLLLQAFAALTRKTEGVKMQLILIDRIREKEELAKLATTLGIANDIQWTGLISQQEIAGILRRSHVLISASRVETFGKTIIEAQACGIPVVATKTAGATFIMKHPSQGMLCEINDANSLMKAMGTVFAGYTQYQPSTLQDHVQKRFSKTVVIRQWIELYKGLVS